MRCQHWVFCQQRGCAALSSQWNTVPSQCNSLVLLSRQEEEGRRKEEKAEGIKKKRTEDRGGERGEEGREEGQDMLLFVAAAMEVAMGRCQLQRPQSASPPQGRDAARASLQSQLCSLRESPTLGPRLSPRLCRPCPPQGMRLASPSSACTPAARSQGPTEGTGSKRGLQRPRQAGPPQTWQLLDQRQALPRA